MPTVDQLKVKIFADGADKAGMLEMAARPFIAGLTTNPTLMRKAGVQATFHYQPLHTSDAGRAFAVRPKLAASDTGH